MNRRSLKLRLLVLSGLSIISVLVLIGAGLLWLFQHQLLERTQTELGYQLNQLAAIFSEDEDGRAVVENAMTDPRYDRPLSGLYWQVSQNGAAILRSRSLWDSELDLTGLEAANPGVATFLPGPGESELVSLSRRVSFRATDEVAGDSRYWLVVAIDTADMQRSRDDFVQALTIILALSGLTLIIGAWAQVHFGLRPLDRVRQNLETVRQKRLDHLDADSLPAEVQPLVVEINALLEAQRAAIEQTRQRSVDLAHGLKTPLAAIAAQMDRLQAGGETPVTDSIHVYLETMRRHVEAELARVRAQGSRLRPVQPIAVAPEVAGVVDILKKLAGGDGLEWIADIDPQSVISMDREDLAEVLGVLLDNGRKWARTKIVVLAEPTEDGLRVTVEDDGEGIADAALADVIIRGTRLDVSTPGTGLGLSIADAILDTYNSRLQLGRAALGGLRVSFEIQNAASSPH